jgi:hypothetical protein
MFWYIVSRNIWQPRFWSFEEDFPVNSSSEAKRNTDLQCGDDLQASYVDPQNGQTERQEELDVGGHFGLNAVALN